MSSPTQPEFELTEELIKSVDSTGVPTPEDRANKVLAFLRTNPELTNWDALCFAVNFIAAESLQVAFLTPAARVLNKWLYLWHYVDSGFKDQIPLAKIGTKDGTAD